MTDDPIEDIRKSFVEYFSACGSGHMEGDIKDLDPKLIEIARQVLADYEAFRESFPMYASMLRDKSREIVISGHRLHVVTRERDELKAQLQTIGKKAFWAASSK